MKVAVLVDKTKSAVANRTEPVELARLETLVVLVDRCGGAIGLAGIVDRSDVPLWRYQVRPPATAPDPPPADLNPFEFADRQADYERRLTEHRAAEHQRRLAADPARRRFLEAAQTLLLQSPGARTTDVSGAIARADLFLAEPEAEASTAGHRHLLIVSDTKDTVGRRMEPTRSGASTLVVTAGALGSMVAALDPLRFESVQAAVEYVVALEASIGARERAGSRQEPSDGR